MGEPTPHTAITQDVFPSLRPEEQHSQDPRPKTAWLKFKSLEGRDVPAVVTYDVGAGLSVHNTLLLDQQLFFDTIVYDTTAGPLSIQIDAAPTLGSVVIGNGSHELLPHGVPLSLQTNRILTVGFAVVAICTLVAVLSFTMSASPHDTGPNETKIDLPADYRADSPVFSPDSKFLVTLGRTGRDQYSVDFWDSETGKRAFTIPGDRTQSATCFSKDGKRLLVLREGAFQCISVAEQKEEMTFVANVEATGILRSTQTHGRFVLAGVGSLAWIDIEKRKVEAIPTTELTTPVMAISPDGTRIMLKALKGKSVLMINTATSKLEDTIPSSEMVTTALTYSPDGKLIAVGNVFENAKIGATIHDAKTLKPVQQTSPVFHAVKQLAFTQDSKYLLTQTGGLPQHDNGVYVWEVKSGELKHTISMGRRPGSTLALSANDHWLVTGANDGTVRKWDFATIRKEFEAKAEKEKK